MVQMDNFNFCLCCEEGTQVLAIFKLLMDSYVDWEGLELALESGRLYEFVMAFYKEGEDRFSEHNKRVLSHVDLLKN